MFLQFNFDNVLPSVIHKILLTVYTYKLCDNSIQLYMNLVSNLIVRPMYSNYYIIHFELVYFHFKSDYDHE